jgi:tetratricopeptide (TPR) repeat protein
MANSSSGSLGEIPLGNLIGKLATSGYTGMLRLEQDTRRYTAWFRSGSIIAAESAAPEDTLGRVALDGGLVDPSAVGESLRRMAQDRSKSQLDVLLEMGALNPERASKAIRMTLTRRSLRMFALPHATFALEAGAHPPDGQASEPLEPRWVVYRGVRQHYREERLERELGSLTGSAMRITIDPGAAQHSFGFADDELVVLAYLAKGYWELEDLATACLTLPREAVMAVVYALRAFDALDVQSAMTVPRLRKRAREATQELSASSLRAAHAEFPLEPAVRARTGVTHVGPAPAPAPPARTPNGTGFNRSTTGPVRAPTGPLQDPNRQTGPQAQGRPTGSFRAESPTNPSGTGPLPKVGRGTLEGAGATGALKEQIIRKLGQVEAHSDYFTILNVPRDAGSAAVKSAYFQLAKMYHPDRLSLVKLEQLRPQVEKIFARLSEAYAVLGDDKKRAEYAAAIDRGGTGGAVSGDQDEVARATKILSAEEHFRKGEMALRRQLYSLAEKEFKIALELNPEEGEHHAMAAWAAWCNAENKEAIASSVKKELNRAIELNPKCAPAFYYLGQLYKHMGDEIRAMASFQKVLNQTPGHVDALREVRLIDMRRKHRKK